MPGSWKTNRYGNESPACKLYRVQVSTQSIKGIKNESINCATCWFDGILEEKLTVHLATCLCLRYLENGWRYSCYQARAVFDRLKSTRKAPTTMHRYAAKRARDLAAMTKSDENIWSKLTVICQIITEIVNWSGFFHAWFLSIYKKKQMTSRRDLWWVPNPLGKSCTAQVLLGRGRNGENYVRANRSWHCGAVCVQY